MAYDTRGQQIGNCITNATAIALFKSKKTDGYEKIVKSIKEVALQLVRVGDEIKEEVEKVEPNMDAVNGDLNAVAEQIKGTDAEPEWTPEQQIEEQINLQNNVQPTTETIQSEAVSQ